MCIFAFNDWCRLPFHPNPCYAGWTLPGLYWWNYRFWNVFLFSSLILQNMGDIWSVQESATNLELISESTIGATSIRWQLIWMQWELWSCKQYPYVWEGFWFEFRAGKCLLGHLFRYWVISSSLFFSLKTPFTNHKSDLSSFVCQRGQRLSTLTRPVHVSTHDNFPCYTVKCVFFDLLKYV